MSSPQNNISFEESYKKAKKVLKSNKALNKYEKYYYENENKAIAQSKINSAWQFVYNRTSKEYAIEDALNMCNQRLLKKYDKLTDLVSCELIKVNNEWKK